MAKIPGDGNTVPFPASDGTYDPNQISEDLRKRVDIPTIPDQPQNLPTRRGRTTEVVKEMFVWELRHYLDSVNSPDDLLPVPTVMKFASDLPNPHQELDPLETVLRIIRSYPDLMERLPYVGVVASAGKNIKLSVSGKYVAPCQKMPMLVAGTGPFPPPVGPPAWVPPDPDDTNFNDNEVPGVPGVWPAPTGAANLGIKSDDWVEITTVVDGGIHVEKFTFPTQLVGVSPQPYAIIADAINYEAQWCHSSVIYWNGEPRLAIEPGGPLGKLGSYFEIFRSDASANFDAWINLPTDKLIAPSNQFPMQNRYVNSLDMTVGLIIGTDGDTLRTEITDLISNFFIFVMNTRNFTFYGRSFFGNTPDEFYQIIIKDADINIIGEQEIPRPDDPIRRIYVNRIDIPITLLQYIDRPVQMGATVIPYELATFKQHPGTWQFSGIAQLEAPDTKLYAGTALLNTFTSARFSSTAIFERKFAGIVDFAYPYTRTPRWASDVNFWRININGVASIATLEATPWQQLAQDAYLSPTAVLASDVAFDKIVEDRSASDAAFDKEVEDRASGIVELEAAAYESLASTVDGDKIVEDRSAGDTTFDKIVEDRFASWSNFNATSQNLLAQTAYLDKIVEVRFGLIAELDASSSELLSQIGTLDAPGSEAMSGMTDLDAPADIRWSQIAEMDAVDIAAISSDAALEAASEDRVSSDSGELTYLDMMAGLVEFA